jgi:hypothetical protein
VSLTRLLLSVLSPGGGGSKRLLWVLEEDGPAACLGKVGLNNKFCIKTCEEGKTHCGVIRHGSRFVVIPNTAYVRVSDHQVASSPSLDLSILSRGQREKLLEASMSAADWEVCFQSIQSGDYPDWLIVDPDAKVDDGLADVESVDLLSPIAAKEKYGVFKIIPTFSFDSDVSDYDEKVGEDGIRSLTEGRVKRLEDKMLHLKEKLSRPFIEIDAGYNVLTSDLVKLNERVKQVTNVIGPYRATESVGRWLESLTERLNNLEDLKASVSAKFAGFHSTQANFKDELNHTMEEVAELQAMLVQSQGWMANTAQTLEVFKKRFGVIRPLLNRFTSSPGESDSDLSKYDTLHRQLQDMQEKIKILENRVVGSSVQMGNCVFQSFEDLHKWVQVKIPKGRFGLFVDGHSFLEFYTLSGHIDTEAGAAAFSHSQKAGFTTYTEAQLAISFKNLFPAVFGKGGASNLDDSEYLPAISNGDKWNNGSTRLHHQLLRNMNDVSYQIDSSIKKVLSDHAEARQLAIDCVTASKRFAIDLISFMSQEYATWQQRGFPRKEAWRIVCQIVRRIFEDMQSARIYARNVQDLEDVDFTTASFLYAALKCHEIMEGYVKHQFHAHPHVSSVITRHLAANFVKPEEAVDSQISALWVKVDSHESKINLYIAKEKEKKKWKRKRQKKGRPRTARGSIELFSKA